MTPARLTTLILTFLALLGVAACGASSAELKPREGAQIFSYQDGTVNGVKVRMAVAAKAIDRARLYTLVDFADEKNATAAALVFGGIGKDRRESELNIVPDFGAPADLVFINKAGKVVSVHDFLPASAAVSATGNQSVASWYRSAAPASIALFLTKGKAAEMKLSAGAEVSFGTDLVGMVDAADPNQLKLFFRPRYMQDLQREDVPKPVELSVRVAMTAEDRARGLIDSDEALLLLYRHTDESWQRDGFWLKGFSGKASFAFMHLKQQGGLRATSGTAPMSGYVQDIVEEAADSGSDDLTRARWWPSVREVRITDSITNANATGPINAILVMPSEKGLSGRGIVKDMWVASTSMTLAGVGNVDETSSLIEKNDLSATTIMVASKRLPFDVYQVQDGIDAVVNSPSSVSSSRLKVIAWDSPSRAHLTRISSSPNQVALLKHKAANRYTVERMVAPSGGVENASTRFALLGKLDELKVGAEVELPWQLVNLRPVLEPGAFFNRKAGDPEPTTLPADAKVKILLEVAQTQSEIARGLMFRESLPENQGMVFKFADVESHEFWMKNCRMDIDVAFINEDMRIVSMHEMKMEAIGTRDGDLKKYRSGPRVKYAVEMSGGWFKANNVQKGDYFWLPVPLRDPK